MAPLRSLGNIRSIFNDFYARTGTDALRPGPIPGPFSASGGTKSTAGSRTYHKFAAPNTSPFSQDFEVTSGTRTVTYLVVGGGGAGSGQHGGGGGAGKLILLNQVNIEAGTYSLYGVKEYS